MNLANKGTGLETTDPEGEGSAATSLTELSTLETQSGIGGAGGAVSSGPWGILGPPAGQAQGQEVDLLDERLDLSNLIGAGTPEQNDEGAELPDEVLYPELF